MVWLSNMRQFDEMTKIYSLDMGKKSGQYVHSAHYEAKIIFMIPFGQDKNKKFLKLIFSKCTLVIMYMFVKDIIPEILLKRIVTNV